MMRLLVTMNLILLAALAILVWDFRTRTRVMRQFDDFTKRFSALIDENNSILNQARAFHEATIEELRVRRQEFDRQVSRVSRLPQKEP